MGSNRRVGERKGDARRRQTFGRVLLGLILALAMVLSGSIALGRHATPPDATITYQVDMQGLKDSFNRTGNVTLRVPHLGVLVVNGEVETICEAQLRGERCGWSELLENGTTIYHVSYSIPLEGMVVGIDPSYANMLLGEYGIYGMVEVPGARFQFSPVEQAEKGIFDQTVSVSYFDTGESGVFPVSFVIEDPDGGCNQVPAPQGCDWPCGTPTQSFVQVDVETSVRQARSDWSDRFTQAFKRHHGSYEMWKDICVELLMKDGGPRAVPDVALNTNGEQALRTYRDWLQGSSSRTTESSAYHLWTDRDLYRCPVKSHTSCPGQEDNKLVGIARTDTAVLTPTTTNKLEQSIAVSVLEGLDIRDGDGYNADNDWDLARLSGHELSHTYGEQHHRSNCRDFGAECNIMLSPLDFDTMGTYWINESRCEVYRWFFFQDNNYDGSTEACVNWYEP